MIIITISSGSPIDNDLLQLFDNKLMPPKITPSFK